MAACTSVVIRPAVIALRTDPTSSSTSDLLGAFLKGRLYLRRVGCPKKCVSFWRCCSGQCNKKTSTAVTCPPLTESRS